MDKDIWIPNYTDNHNELDLNSWFISNKNVNIKNNIDSTLSETDKTLFKCKKYIIYPNEKQREILLRWMDLYNYTYNQTIKYFRENIYINIKNSTSLINNRKNVKNMIKNDKNMNFRIYESKNKIPEHTIDNAINDVCKAYKSALSNLKNKNIKHFRLRYKKLHTNKKTLIFESKCFSEKYKTFSVRGLGKDKLKGVPTKINHDCRLNYIDGEFTLFVPVSINQTTRKNRSLICGLDPGIRTFQTLFSENECVNICVNPKDTFEPLMKKIDKKDGYRSIKAQNKHKKKLRKKLKNKVNDLHWKTANYLTDRYENIAIGKLSTIGIVSNKNNLHSSVKRTAYSLAHFTFRQRLQYMCNKKDVGYYEINEYMTSKTCTKCKTINENLGSSKLFDCSKCNLKIDRDYCGARNIMLKHLKLF